MTRKVSSHGRKLPPFEGALWSEIAHGNLEQVKYLLSLIRRSPDLQNITLAPRWERGFLFQALELSDRRIAQEVLSHYELTKNYFPIQQKTNDNKTTLWQAAAQGFEDLVIRLLAYVSVDQADSEGVTPLMIASQRGHKKVVEVILNYFRDPTSVNVLAKLVINRTNIQGDSALHMAYQHGHVDIAELLLQHGAISHLVNNEGHEPLALKPRTSIQFWRNRHQPIRGEESFEQSTSSGDLVLQLNQNRKHILQLKNLLNEYASSLQQINARKNQALFEKLYYLMFFLMLVTNEIRIFSKDLEKKLEPVSICFAVSGLLLLFLNITFIVIEKVTISDLSLQNREMNDNLCQVLTELRDSLSKDYPLEALKVNKLIVELMNSETEVKVAIEAIQKRIQKLPLLMQAINLKQKPLEWVISLPPQLTNAGGKFSKSN